ncbi:MFS transporter [Ellagibacter isourolithinifaciens]|uniref:MFS transporter n=1 Tax=Ellagibacter isourolithinifaciens TaxID=2137581 RepID=UPI003A954B83
MTTKEAVPKSTQSKRNPLDYPIATSLITEFTPKHHRAISMGMVSAAWYLGATVAAVVGFALCDVDGGWRLMLGSAIIPCVFLLIGRCKVPESPLWLKNKGRHEEARRVVFRVYGAAVILEDEEESPSTRQALRRCSRRDTPHASYFWGSSRYAVGLLVLGLFPTAPFSR